METHNTKASTAQDNIDFKNDIDDLMERVLTQYAKLRQCDLNNPEKHNRANAIAKDVKLNLDLLCTRYIKLDPEVQKKILIQQEQQLLAQQKIQQQQLIDHKHEGTTSPHHSNH